MKSLTASTSRNIHTLTPILYDEGALSDIGIVLQELTVDIVLTDYCMPEMTGYDLLKAIKVVNLLLADFKLILSSFLAEMK